MRLFIALDLAESVKGYLYNLQSLIKGKGFGKFNWVFKKNIHITLKFLGEVSDDKIEEISKKLESIKADSFSVNLESLNYFVRGSTVSVLWAGVSNQKYIIELQKLVDMETIGLGDLKLGSHITLGRVKSLKEKKEFISFIKNFKFEQLKFEIDSFSLYKSDLYRGGPNYLLLKKYLLQKR